MGKNRFSDSQGPSQRQLRVGELIRRTLSEILTRGEVHDPDLGRMSITVGEVRTSPELRRLVTKNLTLKFSPDLKFLADDTFDRMDATRRLLDQEQVKQDVARDDDPAD